MNSYLSKTHYLHSEAKKKKIVGILLTNIGTPDAPTPAAVRRYLAEFLSDPRVIEIPRILWWLILYGLILPIRSRRSAKLYQKIWTDEGSPLRVIFEQQIKLLQARLGNDYIVVGGMRYGKHSIADGLAILRKHNIQQLLVFPLFPQYSASTTATTFDAVAEVLKTWRWQPAFRFINGYYDNEHYIRAVGKSIQQYWQQHNKTEKLLFSFHGLPQQFLVRGDPYYCFCQKTARLIAENLRLSVDEWQISFQSRLGRAAWLKPYTSEILQEWPAKSIKNVTVVCPGFSADCLETLEEIQQLNRDIFMRAGGEQYHYVPALNTSEIHIDTLANIVAQHTQGW